MEETHSLILTLLFTILFCQRKCKRKDNEEFILENCSRREINILIHSFMNYLLTEWTVIP